MAPDRGRTPNAQSRGGSVSRPGGGGARDGAARASAGLAGPWGTLARRTPPSSPHSLSAPQSLSQGRKGSTLEGKLQTSFLISAWRRLAACLFSFPTLKPLFTVTGLLNKNRMHVNSN